MGASVSNLRDNIMLKKKTLQDEFFMVNPENSKEVFNPEETNPETLKYCTKVLINNEPKENFKDAVKKKNFRLKLLKIIWMNSNLLCF